MPFGDQDHGIVRKILQRTGFFLSVFLLIICLMQIVDVFTDSLETGALSDKKMFFLRMWTIASIMLVTVGCIYSMVWLTRSISKRQKVLSLLVLFTYMLIVVFLVALMVLL